MTIVTGTIRQDTTPIAGAHVHIYRRDTGALLGSATTGTADGPADGDIHYDKVLLHLPCSGTFGSTQFIDRSPRGLTATAIGNAAISTSVYPTGALALNGAMGYVSVAPVGIILEPISDDFTIDIKFYALNNNGNKGLLAFNCDYHLGIGQWGDRVACGVSSNGYNWTPFTPDIGMTLFKGSHVITANAWHTYSFERYGNIWTGYLDGVIDCQQVSTSLIFPRPENLNLGAWGTGPVPGFFFNGYLRDLRYTSMARYKGPHSPVVDYPTSKPDYGLGNYQIDCGDYSGEVDRLVLAPDGATLLPDLVDRILLP